MPENDETTVTAYDLGRAYAACYPDIDEDEAFRRSGLSTHDRTEFIRGFRDAADE